MRCIFLLCGVLFVCFVLQCRAAAAAGDADAQESRCFPIKPTARYAMDVAAQEGGCHSAEILAALPAAGSSASSSARASSSGAGARRRHSDSSGSSQHDAADGAQQRQPREARRADAQHQQQQWAAQQQVPSQPGQQQQQQCRHEGDHTPRVLNTPHQQLQQPDPQISDFMAVHAAVSSDGAAPVHRSISQLRLEQQLQLQRQHQEQQQELLQQQQQLQDEEVPSQQSLRPWTQADRLAAAGSSSSPGGSSSSSKGAERGWLKQQWQKLSRSLNTPRGDRGPASGGDGSSSVSLAQQQHLDQIDSTAVTLRQRPSTAPGHLRTATASSAASSNRSSLEESSSKAAKAVFAGPSVTGGGAAVAVPAGQETSSSFKAVAAGAVQPPPQQQQQEEGADQAAVLLRAAGPGSGFSVDGVQELLGSPAAAAAPEGVTSSGKSTPATGSDVKAAVSSTSQQQEQQQQQHQQHMASAFALAELWDPEEHPHAASIAAAAAARTVGSKLASTAAHFPHR